MKTLIKLMLVLLTFVPCKKALSQTTNYSTRNAKNLIDSVINTKMNKAGIVGISAAIIVNKKIAWIKGYGYANKEQKIPFTPNTIMNIASIAKTFTGVCLMRAVEENKVALDEDINSYLPFKVINPNFPNEKITLRHLATHTSGLTDRYPIYDSTIFYGGKTPSPLGVFLKSYFSPEGKYYSKDNFLNTKPGTFRSYSNIAAGLAGYIVELRTGKTLGEYGKQYIFKPLEMNNSGWSLSEININNHTKLYNKEGETIKPIDLYEGITYPDGGVRSSVAELSNFFICLLDEGKYKKVRILKEESVKELTRFQFNNLNKPVNVNLNTLNSGIFWATKLGATRVGHNGSDPGVRTFMLSDLTKEIGIVIFFNTSLGETQEGVYFDIYDEIYNYGLTLKNLK